MDGIQIIENAIPEKLADYFETMIFGLCDGVEVEPIIDFKVKREPTAIETDKSPISYKHILKSDAEQSQYLNLFSIIPQLVCQRMNIPLRDIPYARIFLTNPYESDNAHMQPHTDLVIDHGVILYYVNDADGDTVFFDGNNNIIKSVTPKKGTAVLFNGHILHAGGIPIKHSRCIVNYNIL